MPRGVDNLGNGLPHERPRRAGHEEFDMTKPPLFRTCIGILLTLLFAGCTGLDAVRPDTGEGSKFAVYRRSYDEIWAAAVSVAGQRLTLVQTDKVAGSIRAEDLDATFGEVMGIFISPPRAGEKRYIVEVLSLLKHRPQIPGRDTAPQVIAEIKQKLAI
jgi:hypothetical protein